MNYKEEFSKLNGQRGPKVVQVTDGIRDISN